MNNSKAANQQFTLQDLGLAYRKAKVDLYYATHACLTNIVDYEEHLHERLIDLLNRLNGDDADWIQDKDFLGDYVLIPAGLSDENAAVSDNTLVSDPKLKWKAQVKLSQEYRAEFRLMAQNSIDFHVVSALWLIEVGYLFDAKLKDSAYGSRLRLTEDLQFDKLSLGSFKPYLKPYRDWRDGGIWAIKDALTANKHVVTLTADIKSFYHRLKPDFMLDSNFLELHEFVLDEKQFRLHTLFITALQNWASTTPLQGGLPVGLPASAVIANLALLELDLVVVRQLAPLYYGRYVDDIMLVLENTNGFSSGEAVWDWLISHTCNLLQEGPGNSTLYCPSYLKDCHIEFSRKKTKVFILDPTHGPYLVNSILLHVQERASEWRALPCLPETADAVRASIVQALNSDGEPSVTLGNSDRISARRAAFAIKLRDFEAYAHDLLPEDWEQQRHALFDVAVQHILVLPVYLDTAVYLPRLIKLAIACEDFRHLRKMLKALEDLIGALRDFGKFSVKGILAAQGPANADILKSWVRYLRQMLLDSVYASFPFKLSKGGQERWKEEFAPFIGVKNSGPLTFVAQLSLQQIKAEQARYFSADLAYQPFRVLGLPAEILPSPKLPDKKQIQAYLNPADFIPSELSIIVDGLQELGTWTLLRRGSSVPAGMLFATRPFALVELFLLKSKPFHRDSLDRLNSVLLATRGFRLTSNWPTYDKQGRLCIPDGEAGGKRRIALSSWKTEEQSWVASVMQQHEPDNTRYQRLMTLVEDIVKKNRNLHYLVLPELAIPCAWYMRLLHKLRNTGISLIAGVQYIHAKRRRVHNQVWAALTHDGLGFRSVLIYRQDKQLPALHEEREIERLNNLTLTPEVSWPVKGHEHARNPVLIGPPVIQHGNFMFAILICSELTNILYRAALRGKIDALFVPEWNKDITTFEPLVESAALDVHAYIVQCNDRQYGDSRIRAPYKEAWQRDLIRVKGGLEDYYVVGEIDFQALRNFQSSYRSSESPFKPVPDGFQIAHERKGIIE